MKNIFVLGSTGSIGKNTLDVIAQHPGKLSAKVLVTNINTQVLEEQIYTFKPEIAVVYNEEAYEKFVDKVNAGKTRILKGVDGIRQAILDLDLDIFLNAFVGFAGFVPTIDAIKQKLDIALANKETLVVAGEYITKLVKQNRVNLFPIDSEHSAIWQCLQGEQSNKIKRIILTASAGPFRTWSKSELENVTVQQALNHPNWKMGSKITIDSATLMNKGLEVIEAYWLYGVTPDKIEVVIHPQSIIHSMVEFEDNSIKAQLGLPDMRIPIQYALSYPERFTLNLEQLDFNKYKELSFESPDYDKFPCLKLAYDALRQGETFPAVLNAANEVAVDAFLKERIKFMDIPRIIEESLSKHVPVKPKSYEEYLEADKKGRDLAINVIKRKQN